MTDRLTATKTALTNETRPLHELHVQGCPGEISRLDDSEDGLCKRCGERLRRVFGELRSSVSHARADLTDAERAVLNAYADYRRRARLERTGVIA